MIQNNASPTLDGLFRRVLARQPDALALRDPQNKQRITGQPPKRLTFAEADRAISALSAHFIDAGLPARWVTGFAELEPGELGLVVDGDFPRGDQREDHRIRRRPCSGGFRGPPALPLPRCAGQESDPDQVARRFVELCAGAPSG